MGTIAVKRGLLPTYQKIPTSRLLLVSQPQRAELELSLERQFSRRDEMYLNDSFGQWFNSSEPAFGLLNIDLYQHESPRYWMPVVLVIGVLTGFQFLKKSLIVSCSSGSIIGVKGD